MRRRICITLILFCISQAAAALRAKLPDPAVPDSMGVNIHFNDPRPGEMQMLADAGFKWIRMDFTWGGIERKKGEYDFAAYDRLLQTLEPHGIRAIFILDYFNHLYDDGLPPHTDEGRAAMATFAAAAVTHFKGKGIIWEMWNEPNIPQFWKPKPSAEDYAKLAIAVGKSIRATAPDELYVGPATSTIDLKFLETCFKAGCLEYWDAVSVHPYRQKDPETANDEYRKLRLLIAGYVPKDKKVPILCGEWGYSAGWSSFDETRQARYLPRQLLTNLYNEIPTSIWYDWHDDGQDPKEPEHHFGTVHNPYRKDTDPVYEPKPAYLAMKTLTAQLGGFKYNKRLAMTKDEDWVLIFSKGVDVRVVAWTTSPSPHDVTIPASPGRFAVTTYLGEKTAAAKADADGLRVTLTPTPQYFTPDAANDFLRVVAAWERMPLEVMSRPPKNIAINWSPRNPLDRPIRVNGQPVPPRGDASLEQADGGVYHSVLFFTDFPIRPPVTRSSPPRRESWSMKVEGMGEATQSTLFVVTNPLNVRVYPPVGHSITVGVSNPSGEAFEGNLEFRNPVGLVVADSTQSVKFQNGTTDEAFVRFPLGAIPDAQIAAGVRIENGGKVVVDAPRRRFRLVPDGKGFQDRRAEDVFRIAADGDRKVSSRQEIRIGKPPAPTPTGQDAHVLKLSYEFDAGWKFLQLKPAAEDLKQIEGTPRELALWIYGDASHTSLRARFTDSIGQTFQPIGPSIDFKGWRYVIIPLDGPDLPHWGKGDGQIHSPIKWDTLLLIDNVTREKTTGELHFTGLTLIE